MNASYFSKLFAALGLSLGLLAGAAFAEPETLQFNLVVVSASGVTLNGQPVAEGMVITEDNIDDIVIAEGGSLKVRNQLTGLLYLVTNAADLKTLATALAKDPLGATVARWAVGGVNDRDRSTFKSLNTEDNTGGNVNTEDGVGVNEESQAATPFRP